MNRSGCTLSSLVNHVPRKRGDELLKIGRTRQFSAFSPHKRPPNLGGRGLKQQQAICRCHLQREKTVLAETGEDLTGGREGLMLVRRV